ncbi:MAG TPA: YkgJ family cysteine cluster protein [bacterium]|nr:YkgJ family cysteine cluster protein [bacterium]
MSLPDTYRAIEAKTAAFSRETGIGCPPGCGECCTAIDFAISAPEAELVAEFLLAHPDALVRFESREIEDARVLKRKVSCPLYDAENLAAHCTVYDARPLLCRTFAFAAHREKDGGVVYAPCHKFRDDPAQAARVEEARAASRAGKGPALPILPDESLSVWALDPSGAGNGAPIGPAVRDALERLRFRHSLGG